MEQQENEWRVERARKNMNFISNSDPRRFQFQHWITISGRRREIWYNHFWNRARKERKALKYLDKLRPHSIYANAKKTISLDESKATLVLMPSRMIVRCSWFQKIDFHVRNSEPLCTCFSSLVDLHFFARFGIWKQTGWAGEKERKHYEKEEKMKNLALSSE